MKKAQAIKFWKANHENTNVRQVISSFENKKGYASARTLERYVQADNCFKEWQPSEMVANKTGWSLKHIDTIRPWWQEEFGTKEMGPRTKQFDLENHRRNLLGAVVLGLDIAVFPPRDLDLAIFWSRPNEPYWPIAGGQIERWAEGRLGVRLFVEDKLEWVYSRQHLTNDPIWNTIDDWKKTMVMDFTARFVLFDKIIAEIQSEVGLLVQCDLMGSGNDKEALGLYYAYTLYDQVFCRVVGIPLSPKHSEDFVLESSRVTRLGGYVVVMSRDPSLHTHAINYLLEAQISIAELPEAEAIRAAYEEALLKTTAVKQHVERIRLAVAFPEGSTCDGCREWVTTSEQ